MRELAVVCRFLPAVRIKICNKIPKSSARRPVLQLLRKNGVRVISGSLGECSVFSLLPHHMRSQSIVISYGALNGCQPRPRISASVLNGINVNGSSLTIASSFNSTFKAVRDCMLQLLGPLPGIFNLHFNMKKHRLAGLVWKFATTALMRCYTAHTNLGHNRTQTPPMPLPHTHRYTNAHAQNPYDLSTKRQH